MADLDAAIDFYQRTFGMRCVHVETNVEQGVREAMLAVGPTTEGGCVQLLAPLTPESTIAKFLDRNGPGVQQVAYTVVDIDAACAALRERGMRLLYDAPRRGTADSRINFVHPKDAGGVLIELVQPAPTPTDRQPRTSVRGWRGGRTPSRIGGCSFSQRTSRPSYRSVTSGPTGARPVPDVSNADMAVVPTGADDGSTRARAGADEPEVTVQDILEAIMAAEESNDPDRELAGVAGLPVPESYRGVVVRAEESRMFDGMATRDKDPARPCTCRRCRRRSWRRARRWSP